MPTGPPSSSWGSGGVSESTPAPSRQPATADAPSSLIADASSPENLIEVLESSNTDPTADDLCQAFERLLEMQHEDSAQDAHLKVFQMAMRHAAELSGQGMASVAIATARVGTRSMLDVLLHEVMVRLDAPEATSAEKRLSVQQLSVVAQACAMARYHPGSRFLQALLQDTTAQLQALPVQYLVQIAWSMAVLGHMAASPMIEAVLRRTASEADQITAKDRAQLFWAAAVLDVASPAALERLAELLSTVQPADVDRDFHAKLFQAHMALERLAAAAAGTESGDKEPMARPPLRLLSGEMLAQAEAAWRCVLADVSSQTQAQQEACAALSELGLSHAAAVITNGGLLKPDVVVMTPTARVALTLDQASSFSTNAPHRPLGDAILTWRLLVLHDWQVVSVPFYKWETLDTLEARVSHLRELLVPSAARAPRGAHISARSSSATMSREGLGSLQKGPSGLGCESTSPAPDLRVSATRQRSLSADLSGMVGASVGAAATTGVSSAAAAIGGRWSLDGAAVHNVDPSNVIRQLLAAQQNVNPFSQPGSQAAAELVEGMARGNLSDPGGGLRSVSLPGQASQLASSFLPRPSSLHHLMSVGTASSHPSDTSTSLRTLSSDGSRSTAMCQSGRHPSESFTATSGESTSLPMPWSGADARGRGAGGGGAAEAAGGLSSSAALTRCNSASSQGAAQMLDPPEGPPLPEPPEGSTWSMQDLAARLAPLSGSQASGMSSLGMPNPVQQLGSLPYPPEGGLPADVAAALRLQQQQVQLHLGLPGGTLEEQLLAARGYAGDLGHTPMMPLAPLSAQQHAALSHILSPGSAATSLNSVGGAPHEAGGPDLRQLWQNVTRLEPGQGPSQLPLEAANPAELKRIIEGLPLETSAVAAVEWRLGQLDPPQFAALLTELARDNHAFRAWQLFDWVRALPEGHALRRLCDANTYATMITLCGPWQQLRRALQLVAEMRARSLECGTQAYSALLHAAVKCGETDLALDLYGQMGREGMPRDRSIYVTLIEMFVKLGRVSDALSALADLHTLGEPPDTHLYNLVLVAATKMGPPRFALTVYHRMVSDGAQPNTKTFTALIGSFGKLGSVRAALDIIGELLSHEPGGVGSPATYAALMAACEKAGQGDLALALFQKMAAQSVQPDVGIFNSMIAACAHGGEYAKAAHMFESMAEHGCEPDAVTYANLIRAYKKGGQWCAALDTFEAMLRSGSRPHAAVYSSIIDVLWQTGIPWAQAKALHLFNSAVQNGSLPAAAESCKKGTLKLDLQSLTVGVAVVSMGAWLLCARAALLQDTPTSLDAARKLAVVNGLGEHSRAQGHSAAVKEAVSASLLGCKAPFRMVQDHSRSGRLEASTLALRKWLFSDQFDRYLSLVQAGLAEVALDALQPTAEYMALEEAEKARTVELWQRVANYEALHPISLKVLHTNPGAYLQQRKGLVAAVLHFASSLHVPQEVAHSAVTLMDRVMMSGVHMTDQFQTLFICACLRLAALQENAMRPSGLAISSLTDFPDTALERMEANITAVLRNDMECIAAVHCLKVYCQRLGCDLADGAAVRRAVGCAFALATEALSDMAVLQFPPSLTAAAILVAARRAQGSVPFWPSVLAQLTGYTEASSPPFASAIAHAGRLCSKLYTSVDPAAAPFHV